MMSRKSFKFGVFFCSSSQFLFVEECPMQVLLDIARFGGAVMSHWVAIFGIASLAFAFWLRFTKKTYIPDIIFWCVAIICLFLAFFLTGVWPVISWRTLLAFSSGSPDLPTLRFTTTLSIRGLSIGCCSQLLIIASSDNCWFLQWCYKWFSFSYREDEVQDCLVTLTFGVLDEY